MGEGNDFNLPKTVEKKQFQDLKFSEFEIFKDDERDHEVVDFEYNGEKLVLDLKKRMEENRDAYFMELFCDTGKVLWMGFSYDVSEKKAAIRSNIGKEFNYKDNPKMKGVGLKFYGLLLDYFQDMAQSKQKTFVHEVVKYPGFYMEKEGGELELMEMDEMYDRWDDVFVDFLEQRGYQKDEELWVKEYAPRG